MAEYHLGRIGADLGMKVDLVEVSIRCEGIAQKSYGCYPVLKRPPHGNQAKLHTLLGAGGIRSNQIRRNSQWRVWAERIFIRWTTEMHLPGS